MIRKPVSDTRSGTTLPHNPVGGAPAAQAAAPAAPPSKDARLLRERMSEQLRQLNVGVHEAAGPAEARAAVVAIARRHAGPGRPVLLWRDPLLERLGLGRALQDAGLEAVNWPGPGDGPGERQSPAWLREVAARAAVGVTSVDFAVAATGTLVLASGPGRGRCVSLLPWVHVAVVEEAHVVASLEELFARLSSLTTLPSSVALITGPSRSADIENDLSIGVHGPGELHVVWLRDAAEPAVEGEASQSADSRSDGIAGTGMAGGAGEPGESRQLP